MSADRRCPWCGGPLEHGSGARVGRPSIYCSHSCRQAAYRARTSRATAERDHRRMVERIETIVAMTLDQHAPRNSRISTTQRKHLAERITDALVLAGVQQTG